MRKHARSTARYIGALLFGLVATNGCRFDQPCDPGDVVEVGVCVPAPTDAATVGDAATVDAAASDAGGDSECTPGEGDQSVFGRACESEADCGCPAPICMPASLGYCSQIHCDDDPGTCPDGFFCFEVPPERQQDGVTHICMQE